MRVNLGCVGVCCASAALQRARWRVTLQSRGAPSSSSRWSAKVSRVVSRKCLKVSCTCPEVESGWRRAGPVRAGSEPPPCQGEPVQGRFGPSRAGSVRFGTRRPPKIVFPSGATSQKSVFEWGDLSKNAFFENGPKTHITKQISPRASIWYRFHRKWCIL